MCCSLFLSTFFCPCFLLIVESSESRRMAGTEICSINFYWGVQDKTSLLQRCVPTESPLPVLFLSKCPPVKGAVSSRFSWSSHCTEKMLHTEVWRRPCFLALCHTLSPKTLVSALLSRSPCLMESLWKHFFWLLPAAPSSLDSEIGLGLIFEMDAMLSPLVGVLHL